jgi:hypothetical protein
MNDLSFVAGDTIEIVDNTDPNWWTGRLNGKQGLFPSSYVENLSRPVPPVKSGATAKKPYKPFGAAFQGMDSPPPANQQRVNSLGLQEVQEKTPDIKEKLNQYKNSMKDFGAGKLSV